MIDLLRRDLGFDGLVITDAFDMGGLAAHFDAGEAAVRGIEAGEDQILFSTDTDAAIAAVVKAVRSGRVSESRIDESVERILGAKRHVEQTLLSAENLGQAGMPAKDSTQTGVSALHIAQKSITLVRDASGLLPLTRHATTVVVTDLVEGNPLAEFTPDHIINSATERLDVEADVLLLLFALRPKSGLGRISVPGPARKLAERHSKRTIAVSFGSPYLLRELGDVSTYVCAWGIQPVQQRAAMRALRGEAAMTGRLPVTI
jgi:beta-N-acetylhexosaminidase